MDDTTDEERPPMTVEEHRRLRAIRDAAWEYVDARREARSPTRIDRTYAAMCVAVDADSRARGLIR